MHSRQTELRESIITGKGDGGAREHDMTHISHPTPVLCLGFPPQDKNLPSTHTPREKAGRYHLRSLLDTSFHSLLHQISHRSR